jgi:hypothetical protein
MKSTHATICWAALCGGLLVSLQTVSATTSVTLTALNTDGGTTSSATNAPVEDSYTKSVYGDRSSGRWADSTGTVWARSQTGWLRLSSDGTSAAQSNIGSWGGQGYAVSQAYWEDRLTVNGGPAVQGLAGEMTVTLVIDGSLALGGGDPYAGTAFANQAGAYFFIQTAMNGTNGKYGANQNFQGGIQLRYVSGGGTATTAYNGNLIGPGVWQVKFPFVFGQQALLYIFSRATADARAVVYGPADGLRNSQATCDFRSGVRWAGITEIRVTNGAVVPDYTVTATSNFDYAAGIAASPFTLTQFDVAPGGVTLSWTDSAMRSYTIERSLTLTPGSWEPVEGVTWPITANSIVLPAQSGPRAFFRVRAE